MQGFNMGRYVPPDQEGVISGNRLRGVRAQKSTSDGVPIVRFEMPFAVWCDGCEARTIGRDGKTHPALIGQGVRFNAEKHRTGIYHSTPIWTFRMRHPACGTMLSIRTDPATTSYLVAEGGRRRREYSDDDAGDLDRGGEVEGGDGPGEANPEWDRLDAFDRLERTIQHRMSAPAPTDGSSEADSSSDTHFSGLDAEKRLSALTKSNARQWDDPYARNCALRAAFRVGRHAREQTAADDDGLRKRLGGLSEELQLLPATDADARHAALIDFGSSSPSGGETPSAVADKKTLAKPLLFDHQRGPRNRVSSAPVLVGAPISIPMPPKLPRAASPLLPRNWTYAATTETAKRQRAIREHLASTVMANTRLTTDPFVAALSNSGGSDASFGKKPAIKGIKRSATETDLVRQIEKREDSGSLAPSCKRQRLSDEDKGDGAALGKAVGATLVSYDSD
ncbi:Protein saf4 [Sporothrix epigloea]|uniref:Protein saf4 n=1 Tax=Sporothrix epigloea TaxID=1892477 RepID=A0ABP0E541_9PEZI